MQRQAYKKLKDGERPQSPGMKYKHYAPAAEVTIIKGSFKQYEAARRSLRPV